MTDTPKDRDELVEFRARNLHNSLDYGRPEAFQPNAKHHGDCTNEPHSCLRCLTDEVIAAARLSIEAEEAAGLAVVPVEPTDHMAGEAQRECEESASTLKIYDAMLDASPYRETE